MPPRDELENKVSELAAEVENKVSELAAEVAELKAKLQPKAPARKKVFGVAGTGSCVSTDPDCIGKSQTAGTK